MKLTAQQVFDATQLIATIVREQRPMPQKGSYRLARMHRALLPEFTTISERRDALITAYDHKNDDGLHAVPPDKAEEFFAKWKEIADEEIEVAVEPCPLEQLDLGPTHPACVRADELAVLGELVTE